MAFHEIVPALGSEYDPIQFAAGRRVSVVIFVYTLHVSGRDPGTTGTIMPYVVARKTQLIIPIGLEKQCVLPVMDIQLMMRTPMESLNSIPSMFLLTGTIVTEIEAFEILSGVSAFQVGAGGIGGAEGAVHLVVQGSRDQVEEALRIAATVHGEPAFVE